MRQRCPAGGDLLPDRMFKFGTDPALSWRPAVLKEFISDTLHAQLRNKAQETLATQPSAEIRALINR